MEQYEELSLCGLYCGGCKNYKENFNCMGCRNETELVNDCPTRACCISKGLLHCGNCAEFPCSVLGDFYNDGVRHHKLAYQNMLRIKEVEVEKWLSEQKAEHTCQCGRRKTWFASKCAANCPAATKITKMDRDKIAIKEDVIPTTEELMNLYSDVEWSAYTNDSMRLKKAIENSLKVLTAWDDDKLVGLIRVIGDNQTIIYIQDI